MHRPRYIYASTATRRDRRWRRMRRRDSGPLGLWLLTTAAALAVVAAELLRGLA